MKKRNQIVLLSLSLLFMGCTSVNKKGKEADGANKDSLVFVTGSYSAENEEGIKVFTFSQDDAGWACKGGISGVPNPSFLSELTARNIIYSVSEGGGDSSFLYSLKYSPDSMRLEVADRDMTGGASPCFVMADWSRGKAFTANYSGGSLTGFDADGGGNVARRKVLSFRGRGVNPSRQEKPHVHSVYYSPDSSRIWACDLGTDRIRVIRADDFTYTGEEDIVLPDGSGPRHMCFHSGGKYAYVITELSGDVVVLDTEDGGTA